MTKNNVKVLIIDDNYSILQYLKTLLERYGFTVKTSTNGYEGLQDSAEFKPDIIFLDLMMPNIDGIKMLQLKKVLNDIKEIPVIVISANAGRNNVIAAIEAGADRVLAKPINIKQLKATVNELLNFECFGTETENEYQNVLVQKNENELDFIEKFSEYKINLSEAIENREPKNLKNIVNVLIDFAGKSSRLIVKELLNDLSKKEFAKPSDWMFAELIIKQIEHELNKSNKQNLITKN
ncbi:MAG: response regulator [Ignavibacteriae bacterium]|nr:response regulator [Ignavibacteriota bacterium]